MQSLLESKELNALVNVHSKVAKVCKDDRLIPIMSTSMQVEHERTSCSIWSKSLKCCLSLHSTTQTALEVLDQVSQRCHVSAECKDIFHLLQTPHLQVCVLRSFRNACHIREAIQMRITCVFFLLLEPALRT